MIFIIKKIILHLLHYVKRVYVQRIVKELYRYFPTQRDLKLFSFRCFFIFFLKSWEKCEGSITDYKDY